MPFDNDVDIQVTERGLHYLAQKSGVSGLRVGSNSQYLLEVK